MNKERILALADLIEPMELTKPDSENGFTMLDYRHSCGTPACIAGWAASLARPGVEVRWQDIEEVACVYLGIKHVIGDELFAPTIEKDWSEITPVEAAATLRHFAETGEVVWEPSEATK